MSVIKKPDLKIFAQDAKTGEVETFPDILRGWGVTLDRTAGKPPLEWFNAIGKRVDEWLMYLTQRGVAEWDTTLSYPKTAIVQFNSIVYVSIKETKGEQPDKSQASWSTLGVFLGLGNYYNKTESDTKFQPKGDYATNTVLNNSLALKFDKAGGTISGVVIVEKNVQAVGEVAVRNDDDMLSMKTANASTLGPHFVSKRKSTNTYRTHSLPDETGMLMHRGDFGWGGYGSSEALTENQVENKLKTSVTHVWRNQSGATKYTPQYGASIYIRASDTFFNLAMGHASGSITATSGVVSNSAATFKIANLYSDLNTTVDRNGCLRSLAIPEISDYPVGSPIPWPQSTAPAGFLICNGQSFNKTTYPLLAKAYSSGILPDLRSEFIRGFDAGRNIDTGRTILSYQSDAIRNITGETGEMLIGDGGTGIYKGAFTGNILGGLVASSSNGKRMQTSIFDVSKVVPTANENRPRNIAFLYIVRAA